MVPSFKVGVARRVITPPVGVELAGLGYYLERRWQRVRDDLTATAMVLSDEGGSVALVAADLLYNDQPFWHEIQRRVSLEAGIPGEAICGNFSHTHNAPTAGLILGGGSQHPGYLKFVADQTVAAVAEAAKGLQPARLFVGRGE